MDVLTGIYGSDADELDDLGYGDGVFVGVDGGSVLVAATRPSVRSAHAAADPRWWSVGDCPTAA